MNTLEEFFLESDFPAFDAIQASAKEPFTISGLQGASRALVIAHTYLQKPQNILVICSRPAELEIMKENLCSMVGEEQVLDFPSTGLKPYQMELPYGPLRESRMQVFERLYRGERLILLAQWETLLERLPQPEVLHQEILHLTQGQTLEIQNLRERLVEMGFSEEPMVENIGEFSVRGGIVDIFPLLRENPLRLDFFDDELETIREFDIFTQRSLRKLKDVELFPMDECVLTSETLQKGLDGMLDAFGDADRVGEEETRLVDRGDFGSVHWQRAYFQDLNSSLIEMMSDSLLFIDEGKDLGMQLAEFHLKLSEGQAEKKQEGFLLSPSQELFQSEREIQKIIAEKPRVYFRNVQWEGDNNLRLHCQDQKRGKAGMEQMDSTIAELRGKGYQVYLVSASSGQAERLKSLTLDMDISGVLVGYLSSGFVLEEAKLALFTDHQIFNRFSRRVKKVKSHGGVAIPSVEALERGDFVLHEQHGLGQYLGISRMETSGGGQVDCLVLAYAKGDRLRLPVSALNRLEKYSPKEEESPTLHEIGGKRWEATKRKARKNVVKIAKELVELYAKRQEAGGFAFPPDGTIQNEFEGAFEYEPTPDQVTSTLDVKKDMERTLPMDRLVCGDVGFGKTEVAMRAAFKAVSAKKQVAVMVPTTILASQHFENFVERFAGWPVNIEMVSRYKTAGEKREIGKKLKEGKVDIVVGTHALLGKDIKYKDLGLLIIDEEQKFGVKQKEKIREIKMAVDTLCMSATPIPRTLHMSLSGARDISLINTPPRNRLPIETKVMQRDDEEIAEAIKLELARGGQIFIVHDRVMTIEALAADIEEMVPEAHVGVAHGQMKETDLEQIMSAFLHREFDVLVSTSIIESGLDVPNANTIIINNAQNFGVSQLYQMRGRVGRSSVHAYAYMLTPPGKVVSDSAYKRLQALERFTDLGSGYQLAMRDLEIRGAGNMLGTQQSGFIAEVGYEMYMRMVREAMAEITGKELVEDLQPQLEMPIDAYLPESYIIDGLQRIAIYQKVARLSTLEQVKDLEEELEDRYGALPEPAQMLLQSAKISTFCKKMGVAQLTLDPQRMTLSFALNRTPEAKILGEYMGHCPLPLRYLMTEPLQAVIEVKPGAIARRLQVVVDTLAATCNF